MIVILLPLAVCILGLIVYALFGPRDARVARVGEIMFFCGLLATLLHLSARVLELR